MLALSEIGEEFKHWLGMEVITTTGSGFTFICVFAESEQPSELLYLYFKTCVPIPAVLGLNTPTDTPIPEYTPPFGVPVVRVKLAAFTHKSAGAENVTLGVGNTLMDF